ncbi:unnamed protein product, partial [Brassica oleracea]
ARHDSGDDGQDGARHDDEWSPPIGIYTPAKLVFTVETFEHDDVEEEAWLRLFDLVTNSSFCFSNGDAERV